MNGISKNLPTPAESKGMRTIAVALAHVHIVVDDGPNETKTNEMDPGDKGKVNFEFLSEISYHYLESQSHTL